MCRYPRHSSYRGAAVGQPLCAGARRSIVQGRPYTHCSRTVLKRQVAAAAKDGYTCNMGIEPEIYVLKQTAAGWQPFVDEDRWNVPTRGYDVDTTMLADKFLEPMVKYIDA